MTSVFVLKNSQLNDVIFFVVWSCGRNMKRIYHGGLDRHCYWQLLHFFHTQFSLSSFVFRLFFANSIFVKCTLTALPIVVNRIWLQKCQPLQIQSHLSTEVAALLLDSGRLNSQQILLSIPRGKFNISSQSHKLKSWNISLKQQCRNFICWLKYSRLSEESVRLIRIIFSSKRFKTQFNTL